MDEDTSLRRFCLCGASLRGRAAPAGLHAAVLDAWDATHSGAGHGPATVAQARNARRRTERAALTEEV